MSVFYRTCSHFCLVITPLLVATLAGSSYAGVEPSPFKNSNQASQTTLVKAPKLPNVIKINAADIDFSTALIDLNIEQDKKSAERIKSLANISIADNLAKMESGLPKLKNKMNECRNKSFSTEDQKNAGCRDDMTVAICSQLLFKSCIDKELQWVASQTGAMNYNSNHIKDEIEVILKTNNDILKYLYGLKK